MPGIIVSGGGGSSAPAAGTITRKELSSAARTNGWAPSGAIAENMSRLQITGSNVSSLSTGRLSLVGGIVIPGGVQVSTITFYSGTQALVTGSNQWFALYSTARAKLAVTADDTNTAWAANTYKTLTLASPYTPAADEAVYVGICVVASTVPSLRCNTDMGFSGITNQAPILAGTSNTGLTNPASAPATANALTAANFIPYCYVS